MRLTVTDVCFIQLCRFNILVCSDFAYKKRYNNTAMQRQSNALGILLLSAPAVFTFILLEKGCVI